MTYYLNPDSRGKGRGHPSPSLLTVLFIASASICHFVNPTAFPLLLLLIHVCCIFANFFHQETGNFQYTDNFITKFCSPHHKRRNVVLYLILFGDNNCGFEIVLSLFLQQKFPCSLKISCAVI